MMTAPTANDDKDKTLPSYININKGNHARRHHRLYGNYVLTACVFPDPVCAIPTISFPLRAIGQPVPGWQWGLKSLAF
jgi:hypothetical protein